ncbi:hypothetical protein TEA_012204 [Camellia sinensis var. sinensis]|uniref:Receptor-like serine/threonine-protein kinase n=1 Tax=Camellia sinensis var. sinensis TaxID=542762 RepID=A0A4V3WQW5_CAMSN|nr:hypothetical protein TEA_012204 [Camellia sinensis var. sinensis]
MILRQLSIAITISNSFVSFILLCHILTQSQSCFATDNLTQSKSISVSETLTSASQIFELGFFNSNSTAKKYVGIWYKKIPIRKVVWVANRENPLSVTDSGSSLTIGDDGNLRLLDGNQNTVWTTNITVYVNYSVAVLLYTGNLVRRDGVSGESLWEDLSHPCDTSLPGMRLGLNTRLLGKQKTIHRLEILFLGFHHRSHRKSSFGTIQFLSGEVGSGMDSSLLGNRKHVAEFSLGGEDLFLCLANSELGKGKERTKLIVSLVLLPTISAQITNSGKEDLARSSRNLVQLFGCCIEGEELMIVYEYMPNRSLDTLLFDPTRRAQLDWDKRFNIIQDIARGLMYLHRDSCLKIIHRDLKASNVLLDKDMNPKISDFGLARTFQVTQDLENTRRVMGTYGYISPEYALGGIFSEKSDLFSFGVLLLEIVSGMKNSSFHYQEQYLSLLGYDHSADRPTMPDIVLMQHSDTNAPTPKQPIFTFRSLLYSDKQTQCNNFCSINEAWHLWNKSRALDLVDEAMAESCLLSEVMRCIGIGLLCVQNHAADRPTMSAVVLMLSSEIDVPQPKQPTFTIQSLYSGIQSQSNKICSINELIRYNYDAAIIVQ